MAKALDRLAAAEADCTRQINKIVETHAAQLASAEGEITKTKDDRSYWAARCHENVLEAHALRDERDIVRMRLAEEMEWHVAAVEECNRLKAAVEQARQATWLGAAEIIREECFSTDRAAQRAIARLEGLAALTSVPGGAIE